MHYTRDTEARIDAVTGKAVVTVYKVPYRGDREIIVSVPFATLKAARAAQPSIDAAMRFAFVQGKYDSYTPTR